MLVTVEFPDHVILSLATKAAQQNVSIETMILSKLEGVKNLNDLDLETIIHRMTDHAISHLENEPPFTLRSLYLDMGEDWGALSVANRKQLGKRFQQVSKPNCGKKLVCTGKTVTNSQLYEVQSGHSDKDLSQVLPQTTL